MRTQFSSWIAVMAAAAFLTQGCAATMRGAGPDDRPRSADPAVLADYVQRLPPGTSVRVERIKGRSIRGTLMKATAGSVVIQPRTRLPESPVEIPLAEVLAVTPDSGSGGVGKAIAAGVAAGAGAAIVTFFVLIAIFSD